MITALSSMEYFEGAVSDGGPCSSIFGAGKARKEVFSGWRHFNAERFPVAGLHFPHEEERVADVFVGAPPVVHGVAVDHVANQIHEPENVLLEHLICNE